MNISHHPTKFCADRLEQRENSDFAYIWKILDQVQDPEIPVLSLWDLGVLTNINKQNDQVVVTITPTYSGCPAVDAMRDDIISILRKNGIDGAIVKTQLSPAWSSSWLSPEGRKKLTEYGIAPPNPTICGKKNIGYIVKHEVRCPNCNSNKTHQVSEFGSTACKALYQCDNCQEPFDYFKTL
jgi:ring-1,2-phenylacetyl-CoA epoxidase subunit PaaD